MKQDVDAGRPTELDAFLGALIRKADLCGLEVPAAREYYRALSGKS
jgi:2-dehydropantoate 2-reductase